MAASLADILNPTGAVQQQQKSSELYKVSFKDAKSGVYKSVVRFVPNVADPSKSIVQKYVSWVKNPVTKIGKFVDCPSKESGLPSPVSDLYFKLYNTKIASYQDYAKEHLSSKLQYASLVQIVQDEQHPELVGQIKVFTYGKKIWEKLHYEEFPNAGTGTNPFHPIYGRRFSIVCTSQSGFNNFDQSCFFDEKNGAQIAPSGLWYVNPATNQTEIAVDGCDIQTLANYLAANSPDLSKYEPQPWTDDQKAHVNETIAIVENFLATGSVGSANQVVAQQAMNTLNGVRPTAPVFPGATPAATPAPAAPVFPGATTTPQPVAPAQPQFAQPAAPQFNAGGFVPTTPTAAAPAPVFNGGVAGVEVPNVAPQVAPQAAAKPSAGINMDDILANL